MLTRAADLKGLRARAILKTMPQYFMGQGLVNVHSCWFHMKMVVGNDSPSGSMMLKRDMDHHACICFTQCFGWSSWFIPSISAICESAKFPWIGMLYLSKNCQQSSAATQLPQRDRHRNAMECLFGTHTVGHKSGGNQPRHWTIRMKRTSSYSTIYLEYIWDSVKICAD